MSPTDAREDDTIGPISPNRHVHDVTVVRTYLGMRDPNELRRSSRPRLDASLVPLRPCSVAQWRALYASVGAAWHWHDRDAWPDEQLAERLAQPSVHVFGLRIEEDRAAIEADIEMRFAGFLELEQHASGDVEIVYLGLHSRVMGTGLGAWLLAEAVDRAFALHTSHVWLHTCTLDSASALPNYLARGFTPERTESYIARLPL